MAKWFVAAKKADFEGIGRQFQISPVLARIIRNRDVVGEDAIRKYLYGTAEEFYDPVLLCGMETATAILEQKIREGKKIRVIGDYDADGVCATFILKKGLSFCGAVADSAIPHRMKDGYGLNENLVLEAWEDGIDTIITCDNGIAAGEQIALAKQKGMTVIVTDHHEIPYEESENGRIYKLPPADALIDPKLPECEYPFKEICGAFVAYKLISFLTGQLCKKEMLQKNAVEKLLEELLEFAAFATICDVMPLQDENRILVRQGLAYMEKTKNTGLHALMEVNGILPAQTNKALGSFQIGFVLGPCLNASGRLDTASRALALLECSDYREAVMLAATLKQLNDSRKEMTERCVQKAVDLIENSPMHKDRVLVVFLPDCHESIAGIIAGRLRERYFKPVFVLTLGEEGVKGSARSIETYHVYEEMTKIKHFFTKYGGHKMAAGLSMTEENVDAFREEINRICTLTPEDMEERVHIDVPMPVSYVTFSLVEELSRLEPFGTGNPKPVFAQKDLLFLSARVMGKTGNALKCIVMDDQDKRWEMMYFGSRDVFDAHVTEKYGKKALDQLYEAKGNGIRLHVVYYPGINTWQGTTKLQLTMQHFQ